MDDVRHPDATRAAEPVDAPPQRGKRWAFLALLLVFAVLGGGGLLAWQQSRGVESTDDAFIDGHISQVSPQVGGRVMALLVTDNQLVQAGQRLLEIDPRDWQMRLQQQVAQRAQAAAELEQARATLDIRRADQGQSQAQIAVGEADLYQAQRDLARYTAISPHAITRQILDNATAAARSAAARLQASRQAAIGAAAQVEAAKAAVGASQAALLLADTGIANARLQLSYTQVLAPAPGRITRRTVELGNYVNPGQSLLAIVQPGLWITANFKETQLARIRPGQKVAIDIDAFPSAGLSGHVDSLQTGTGAVFSALPVENATGNYVKVVQRLPVKIEFDGDAASRLPLAPGMSVSPHVTVR